MNKKYVTIFLIVAGVAFAVVIAVGLLTKTPSGKTGYKAIVDSWLNRNEQVATVTEDTNQPSSPESSQNTSVTNQTNTPASNNTPSTTQQPTTPASTSSAPSTPAPTTKPSTGGSTGGGSTGGGNGGSGSGGSGGTGGGSGGSTCNAGGSCTAAEVATHATQSSCWVIYGAKVYDITAFIPKHPKSLGPVIFTPSVCGHDVTPYLNGSLSSGGKQHKHNSSAYSTLNTYWYANLK